LDVSRRIGDHPRGMTHRTLAVTLLLSFAEAARAADAGADLKPFVYDWPRAGESLVSNARFLDAPAGKAGVVRVRGEHLVAGDGKRFRAWGINLCGAACFPGKAEAKLIAGDLARVGFNAVRFHHMEAEWGRNIFVKGSNDTLSLDPEALDRLDFLIAELKARGIYSNLNLNVSRHFRPGDGVRDFRKLGSGKGATYFNPRLIELQQQYARQLLTHKNPYTKSEYRHEPAVVTVEIVNENSLLEAWANWRLVGKDAEKPDTWAPLPVSYVEELTDQFNAWLAKNVSADELKAIRAQAGGGRAALLKPDEFAKASELRFHTTAKFLMHLEAEFFKGMRKFLKEELGVQAPVVGSADHNDRTSGYPHLQAMRQLDVIDGHGYWQHPEIAAVTKMPNTPMVNDPLDSTVAQFARTPVEGKPFTITETNEPFPHEYACENYAILTAYALMHDWDGIYWFDWGVGRFRDPKAGIQPYGWFDVSADPVKLTNIAACAAMWYRQDVAAARTRDVRAITDKNVIESLRMDKSQSPFFTTGYDEALALVNPTRSTFPGPSRFQMPNFSPAPALGNIVSDTRQLGWFDADRSRGVVTIDTERTQGLVGYVRGSARAPGGLSADVRNDFCAIICTSLDGQPLTKTTKALLAATSRATNTGFRWTDEKERKTVAEWGKGPVVIEPVRGTVSLALGDAKSVSVQPLTAEGRALGPAVNALRDGGKWRVAVGEPVTTWWVIDVSR
jgi:hypothetical protein